MPDDALNEAKKKLLDINKTITKLDPAIRSAAFDIIAPLIFDGVEPASPKTATAKQKSNPTTGKRKVVTPSGNREAFYSAQDHDKPKDNVFLIAAWLYSQFGKFAITRKDIDEEAAEAGLTVPDRADNTMRQAKHKGKSLFRKKNKGWELTVSGEARVKEQYGVTKGNQPRVIEEDE